MRIRLLRLVDFKRFRDLTIQLGDAPTKIVALVGPNGCGKSSIFDAFEERLKDLKGANYAPPAEYLWRGAYTGLQGAYQKNEAVRITPDRDPPDFRRDSFYIRSSYRFTPRLDVNELRKQPDALQDQVRPGSTSELDGRLTENYQRLQGQLISAYESGDKTGRQVRDELTGKVNGILEQILDIRISSIGNIMDGKGKLYFDKGASRAFPYDNLSSGEKEVVDLILDLVVKVDQYKDTVFAIDEPELHINTAVQRRLIVELEKLIPDSCQLWVATHSIGFLRALQAELRDKTTVIDLSNVDLDSPVVVHPMPKTRQNWSRVFATALDDLTGLVAPNRIYYCEGRAEPGPRGYEQGLDAVVYNQIFGGTHVDVLFVSSGGSTEPQKYAGIALKVLSKAFAEVQLFVLRDKDIRGDGLPTSDADRAAWIAQSPETNRMLRRREIENYLYDHEIVARMRPNFTAEQHAAILPDIQNGDVKSATGQLMRALGLFNGVSAADFKLRLAELLTPETATYGELHECVFGAPAQGRDGV